MQAQEESTRNRSIFEIGDELNAIAEAFDRAEENGDDEVVRTAFEAYFAQLLDNRDIKLDRYAALIQFNQTLADAAKAEAKRCADLARIRENRVAAMKARLKMYFEANGITKIETAKHAFTIAGNGGKLPLVIDENTKPEAAPECFQKVTVDFDQDAIRAALESGEELDFARLGERGTHLRVK